MNIVVDTNVFVSALIKDGATKEIIINSWYNFLFPEFEFYEIKKHKLDILQKSGLPEKEFDILLLRLLNSVKIIPTDIIVKFRNEAFDVIGEIDPDDAQFIATALAFNAVIWSDDKHFQQQNKIKVLTTKDIINFIE